MNQVATVPQFSVWDPSDDQVRASSGIEAWWAKGSAREPFMSIGGYAGTGKTSLVGHLSRALTERGVRIAFVTYTGKASEVLRASLLRANVAPLYVGTIHRLMYRPKVDPKTGRLLGWTRVPILNFDLVIVDEASMVPTEVFNDLMSYGVPLLAVGDHGQLPPVGEDAGVMADPHFRLERIHRQAEGNPIIQLSKRVREGAPMRELTELATQDPSGKLVWFAGYDGLYEAIEFAAAPGLLISFTNRLRVQANKLARLRQQYEGQPVAGETMLCVRNAYLDSGLLANGTRAVLVAVKHVLPHHYVMVLDTGDREPFEVRVCKHQFNQAQSFTGFDEIPGEPRSWEQAGVLLDYGYALTCHKAQGSQSDRVAVLFERALERLEDDEYRRWSYTAVSRSSDKLMLVTDLG